MILALDIGGTSVKLGLVSEDGQLHTRREASVCFDGYKTPILHTALKEAQDFLNTAQVKIRGIGISATGQIDDRTGVVIGTNGKIPGYEGVRLKEAFEREFSLPAHALNDANAAALGECFAGSAKGVHNLLLVTLGTGVGGGVVLDGKLYSGARGIAGELGHFTLYQDGVPCPCGKRGCFETYAATTALLRIAEEISGESGLNGRAIFSRAKAGDPVMREALHRWIGDVAAGLSGLIHIFNPEMLLIGGGVSAQEELLMEPLRKQVFKTVMPRFGEGLRIERACLGNDAGLIGAAKYFMDQENP